MRSGCVNRCIWLDFNAVIRGHFLLDCSAARLLAHLFALCEKNMQRCVLFNFITVGRIERIHD